jgi:hypothetical protein
MKQMTPTAVEPAMKLQDVMLRAMAKRITWFQAAEILWISCRQMQRWHTRFELGRIRAREKTSKNEETAFACGILIDKIDGYKNAVTVLAILLQLARTLPLRQPKEGSEARDRVVRRRGLQCYSHQNLRNGDCCGWSHL